MLIYAMDESCQKGTYCVTLVDNYETLIRNPDGTPTEDRIEFAFKCGKFYQWLYAFLSFFGIQLYHAR